MCYFLSLLLLRKNGLTESDTKLTQTDALQALIQGGPKSKLMRTDRTGHVAGKHFKVLFQP